MDLLLPLLLGRSSLSGGQLSLLKHLPRTPLLPGGPSAPSLLTPKPLLLDLVGAAVSPEASKLSPTQVKERIAEKERTFILAERLQKAGFPG